MLIKVKNKLSTYENLYTHRFIHRHFRSFYANDYRLRLFIYDDEGKPLIRATVSVKGISQDTVSDMDGYYNLHHVDITATLQIAYIDMNTKYIPMRDLIRVKENLAFS